MQRFRWAGSILAAVLVLGLTPTARTGTAADSEVTQRVTSKDGQGRKESLAVALGLTREQKQQIKPILKSQREQLRALRENTNLSPKEKRAKVRAVRDESREKIRQLLTEAQKKKLDAMPRGHRQVGARKGAAANNTAVP